MTDRQIDLVRTAAELAEHEGNAEMSAALVAAWRELRDECGLVMDRARLRRELAEARGTAARLEGRIALLLAART